MATLVTYDENGKLKYELVEPELQDDKPAVCPFEAVAAPPRKKRYKLKTVWGPLYNSQGEALDAYGQVYDGYAQPELRPEMVTDSEDEDDPLALPAAETMDEATTEDDEEDWLQRRIEVGDELSYNTFMQSVPEAGRADYEAQLLALAPQYRVFVDFIASPLEPGKDAVARIEYVGNRYARLPLMQRLRLLHCVVGWPRVLYTQHVTLGTVQIAVAQHVKLMP